MSPAATRGSGSLADVAVLTPLGADVEVVTPADGFGRKPDPTRPRPRPELGGAKRPPRLGTFLRQLFNDGSTTITTDHPTEEGRALARTAAQPDGDIVMQLDPRADEICAAATADHLDQVAEWYRLLHARLRRNAQMLLGLRGVLFGIVPFVFAALTAFPDTDDGSTAAWVLAAVGAVIALWLIVENSLAWMQSGEVPTGDPREYTLQRVRENPWYNRALFIVPPVLTVISAASQSRVFLVGMALLPVLFAAAGLAAFMVFRSRFLPGQLSHEAGSLVARVRSLVAGLRPRAAT